MDNQKTIETTTTQSSATVVTPAQKNSLFKMLIPVLLVILLLVCGVVGFFVYKTIQKGQTRTAVSEVSKAHTDLTTNVKELEQNTSSLNLSNTQDVSEFKSKLDNVDSTIKKVETSLNNFDDKVKKLTHSDVKNFKSATENLSKASKDYLNFEKSSLSSLRGLIDTFTEIQTLDEIFTKIGNKTLDTNAAQDELGKLVSNLESRKSTLEKNNYEGDLKDLNATLIDVLKASITVSNEFKDVLKTNDNSKAQSIANTYTQEMSQASNNIDTTITNILNKRKDLIDKVDQTEKEATKAYENLDSYYKAK